MACCCGCLLKLIGAIVLIKILYKIIRGIIMSCKGGVNLKETYGNGYAVITGSSDGIGLDYAIELTLRGFNIVLIARNLNKLNDVKARLLNCNKSIDVKIICFDFKDANKESDYEPIRKELAGLDISMLVNNVGYIEWNKFHELDSANIAQMVNVNQLSYIYMARMVIPKMMKRSTRSAILMMSSGLSHNVISYCSTYCLTKASINSLCMALNQEYKEKIDICCFDIGNVLTKANPEKSALHIYPNQCVAACLNKVGRYEMSGGHWKHILTTCFLRLLPSSVAVKIGTQALEKSKKVN